MRLEPNCKRFVTAGVSKVFGNGRDAGKANTVISVARLAWPVWLRLQWKKNTRLLLVLHNHDPNDGKSLFYHRLLAAFLRRIALKHPQRVAVVVVSKYWQEYFRLHFGIQALVFPNLFPEEPYNSIRQEAVKDSAMIHLGQWSAKLDHSACSALIHILEPLGFCCYFSSPFPVAANAFTVRFFKTHREYLQAMAASRATVILNRVAEGWPRVAHESILCGTVLIGTPLGGLSELLELGDGYAVSDAAEAAHLLTKFSLPERADPARMRRFSIDTALVYLQPILEWLK